MSVDLSAAQAALDAIFHTNAASILRSVRTNVNGVAVETWQHVAQTTCHPIYPQTQPRIAAVNDAIAGAAAAFYLSLPYGTDIRVDDRVVTMGKRLRVVEALPTPQFALDTVCGVVDMTGEA